MRYDKCPLCNATVELPPYHDTVCPGCGLRYEYEEGTNPVLTREQWRALASIERLEKLEAAAIELVRANDALSSENSKLEDNRIPKGSAADKAYDRAREAELEFRTLAREAVAKQTDH